MRRSIIAGTALLAIVASVPATAQRTKDDDEGVKVRRASIMRNLVPAASLEKASLQQYGQLRAQAVGRDTPYRSLELGVRSGISHPGSRMIYAGPRQPLPPESNPYGFLGRVFAAGGKPYEALRRQRMSTIDVLKADLDGFRKDAPAEDREKLEAHLTAVRGIETPRPARRAPAR